MRSISCDILECLHAIAVRACVSSFSISFEKSQSLCDWYSRNLNLSQDSELPSSPASISQRRSMSPVICVQISPSPKCSSERIAIASLSAPNTSVCPCPCPTWSLKIYRGVPNFFPILHRSKLNHTNFRSEIYPNDIADPVLPPPVIMDSGLAQCRIDSSQVHSQGAKSFNPCFGFLLCEKQ